MDNYDSSTAQVLAMIAEEAKAFLRELLDHSAMRSPEVNQQVRKMLRGQRDQVAWFGRMEPGADAESMPALVDAKPKKMCIKRDETPAQSAKKHQGCCVMIKCSPVPKKIASKKMCIKCDETPARRGIEDQGCCDKCSPAAKKMCNKCDETPARQGKRHQFKVAAASVLQRPARRRCAASVTRPQHRVAFTETAVFAAFFMHRPSY